MKGKHTVCLFFSFFTHNYLVRPSEPSSWFLILSSVSVTGRTLKFVSLKRSRCCRGVLDPSSLIWYRKHHNEWTTVIICHVGCSLISIYFFFYYFHSRKVLFQPVDEPPGGSLQPLLHFLDFTFRSGCWCSWSMGEACVVFPPQAIYFFLFFFQK